jgi:hypothetical protein
MKKAVLVLVVLVILSWSTGCVSQPDTPQQPHNKYITVESPDIDSFEPSGWNIGSVDMYTPQFLITNPTNRTFTNVVVQINLDSSAPFCHSLSKTLELPVLLPREKKIELIPIPEFSNLDCQYSYTYDVVSDT